MAIKKILQLAVAYALLSGLVAALWMVNISGSAVYQVTSTSPHLNITKTFAGANINTQNSSVAFNDTMRIENLNSPIQVLINTSTTKQDKADSCNNYENDCSVNYSISDGIFLLPSGVTEISISINCSRYSCPQDISAAVQLTQV